MSEPTIPPPSEKCLAVDLVKLLTEGDQRWYRNTMEGHLAIRCHAAEAELARLRIAVDTAVRAERERCAKIADACAKERAAALTGFPVVMTPERSQSYYNVASKESEALRIAAAIRGGAL